RRRILGRNPESDFDFRDICFEFGPSTHPAILPLTAARLQAYIRTISEHRCGQIPELAMFFRFPPDARWNAECGAVEFSIGIGEYEGVVRIPRRVFQTLLPEAPTPKRCLEAYHLQRTRLELIAERKLRRRQLTEDA